MILGPDNQSAEKAGAFTVSVKGGGNGGGQTVSFIDDIQPILNNNCSGCHIGGSSGGFSMDATNAWNDIVNVQSGTGFLYIEPNNPTDSYIIMKLRDDSRISGALMPRGRAPLSESVIGLIETWVEQGALNN
jgi:hypothetical protein